MATQFALTSELVRFCQCGVSIEVASCEADGWPVGGMALACRIDPKTQAIRIILQRTPNVALLRALTLGKPVAATFTLPSTDRSIQLKGGSAHIRPSQPDDRSDAAEQTAAVVRELVCVGYAEAYARGFCGYDPADLAAFSFIPTEGYVQTPGPGAGSALTP